MNNIDILREYYKRVCVPLIFVGEHILSNCQNAKVYLYDFKSQEELDNFKKVFQEYIPFYVKNFDRISRYELEKTDEELADYLREKAKGIKTRKEIPDRDIAHSGVYGELFNDFYLRNVLSNDRLITFLSKRSYERQNCENHGIDVVVCSLKGESLEITFSEAKFVTTIGDAKNKLKSDVSEHVTAEYINNYLQFVMQKQCEAMNERKETINEKVNEFNDLIEDENVSFIEALNRKIVMLNLSFLRFLKEYIEERYFMKLE